MSRIQVKSGRVNVNKFTKSKLGRVGTAQMKQTPEYKQFISDKKKKEEELEKIQKGMENISPEQYEQKYSKLSEEYKEFFPKPSEIYQKRETAKVETLSKLDKEIKETLAKLDKEKDKYRERRRKYKDRYDGDIKKDRLDRLEERYDVKKAYLRGYLQKLNESKGKLKDRYYSYDALQNYAHDYGRYEEKKERAYYKNKDLKEEYQDKLEQHNKEVLNERSKQIREWELKNPTEKLILDPKTLEVKGVESGSLQMSMDIDNYNKYIEENKPNSPNYSSGGSNVKFDNKGYGYSIAPELVSVDPSQVQIQGYSSSTDYLNSLNASKKDDNKPISWNNNLSSSYSFAPKRVEEKEKERTIISPKVDKVMNKFMGDKGDKSKDSSFDYYSKEYLPYGLEHVPIVAKDIVVSTGKGLVKAPLYMIDSTGQVVDRVMDKDKFQYGDKLLSEDVLTKEDGEKNKFGEWLDYDYKQNPFKDKDYQTAGITAGFGALGGLSLGGAGVSSVVSKGAGYLGDTALVYLGGKQVLSTVKDPTSRNVGTSLLLAIPTAKVLKDRAKAIYIKNTRDYIPPEQVFSKQVLEKGNKFPTSKNVKEMLRKFGESKKDGLYETAHATTFKFDKNTQLKGSKKPSVEDTGLYVTPKGEGSPYFLDINKNYGGKISFNPFKNWNKNPRVYEIAVQNIKRLPESVRNQFRDIQKKSGNKEAFDFVNKWYEKNAESSTGYIPMRSELGHSLETQGILPVGTNIARTGKKYYTEYKGEVIPLETYQVFGSSVPRQNLNPELIKKIEKSRDYYSSGKADEKYFNPYSPVGKSALSSSSSSSSSSIPSSTSSSSSSPTSSSTSYSTKYPTQYSSTTPSSPSYSSGSSYPRSPIYPSYPSTVSPRYTYDPRYTPKEKPVKRFLKLPKRKGMKTGYSPVYKTKDNKKVVGRVYATLRDAQHEGMRKVDKYPLEQFEIKDVSVDKKYSLLKAKKYNTPHKFQKKGKLYIEKKPYRSDKSGEQGNFNFLKLLTKQENY